MTVRQLQSALSLRLLAGERGLDNKVEGCYVGDLLSWVMGRAQAGDAWITVMGNVNAIAVASLAETACIILSEDAALDEAAKMRANQNSIPILSGSDNAYRLALAVAGCLEEQT